jgi:glutamate--cysteine ligase catalytic subunit
MLRVISHFEIELRVPISCVEENMTSAHARNGWYCLLYPFVDSKRVGVFIIILLLFFSLAVQETLFWFRSDPLFRKEEEQGEQPRWERKTMDDIFNGTDGLCPLVETYMETLVDVDTETMDYVKRVVAFVSQKASGKLCTTATWMRTFVQEHKNYKKVGCLLFSFFFLFATP